VRVFKCHRTRRKSRAYQLRVKKWLRMKKQLRVDKRLRMKKQLEVKKQLGAEKWYRLEAKTVDIGGFHTFQH
jgi:hypothetical protein